MNVLQDVINYIRRIVKTPNNAVLSDALIIDYINRFYIMDMDARIQLFDYKTRYAFNTTPLVDQYNMPYYGLNGYPAQTEPGATIAPYPVYQNFLPSAYVNGIEMPLMNDRESFFRVWPNYLQAMNPVALGNGGVTYTFQLPYQPALRGHIDPLGEIAHYNNSSYVPDTVDSTVMPSSIFAAVYINAIDINGNPLNVQDSGFFFASDANQGLLTGDCTTSWAVGATNCVNYLTGQVNVTFTRSVADQSNIVAKCYFFQPGMPRSLLYYNNVLTLRPPPNSSYLIELDAYLSPAAFFNSGNALPFAYMAEYIARGAARKMLSDTGDVEQFAFYEPLFREQEQLVWKRSQRINTSTRTNTIFSSLSGQSPFSNFGQGT